MENINQSYMNNISSLFKSKDGQQFLLQNQSLKEAIANFNKPAAAANSDSYKIVDSTNYVPQFKQKQVDVSKDKYQKHAIIQSSRESTKMNVFNLNESFYAAKLKGQKLNNQESKSNFMKHVDKSAQNIEQYQKCQTSQKVLTDFVPQTTAREQTNQNEQENWPRHFKQFYQHRKSWQANYSPLTANINNINTTSQTIKQDKSELVGKVELSQDQFIQLKQKLLSVEKENQILKEMLQRRDKSSHLQVKQLQDENMQLKTIIQKHTVKKKIENSQNNSQNNNENQKQFESHILRLLENICLHPNKSKKQKNKDVSMFNPLPNLARIMQIQSTLAQSKQNK